MGLAKIPAPTSKTLPDGLSRQAALFSSPNLKDVLMQFLQTQ